MVINNEQLAFPGINKLSFFKIFETLETMAKDGDPAIAQYASGLLKEMEAYPLLREGFEDLSLIEKYRPQINKLLRFIFPDALQTNEIKGVVAPFVFDPFHVSTRFENILKTAGDDFQLKLSDIDEDQFYRMGCTIIMGYHYKFPVAFSHPYYFEIPNQETGKTRIYRMAFNGDMMEVLPTDKSPELTEEDFHELMENYDDTALWREKFPPNSFIMRGIGVINLMDMTMDHSATKITSNLLVKDLDTVNRIQGNLRDLFDMPDLNLGFTGYCDGTFASANKEAMKSFVLDGSEAISCDEVLCPVGFDTLIERQEPLVIPNVKRYAELSGSLLGKNLVHQNIGSYIILPLEHDGQSLGAMELANPRPFALTKMHIEKLKDVIPIISMAAARFEEEANNRIEAIIQQECTTIHSSVKWKFEEEAREYMIQEENGGTPRFKDIKFKDVYPLYGQSDIKGSSTTRNEAVKTDLLKQMGEVKKLLRKSYDLKPLPALEELIFRVDGYLKEIEDGLMAGSEHKILAFLRQEIYPVFRHLESTDRKLKKAIEKYNSMLDPRVNMIYESRKDFDESVSIVNHRLAALLDQKQEEAQAMFPHYFERYKTDGVEYNMYIGESIMRDQSFDPLYLSNLRLWQLATMCEMEREFHELKSELKSPLEIASLILVYSTPLAIHFRMDEKRFDVEGAYNARYEIVKKRVDKAHIKGTDERITVPNKIAIIYSSDQDVIEYKKYISFLQSKGLLKEAIEDLPLEDLQGITGLRALRVELNYEPNKRENVSYDEIIEVIGKGTVASS